jgi:RNA polymerase subunit RPABC4/transcription elongation factor Spt4
MSPKFCSACGKSLNESDAFCSGCGKKTTGENEGQLKVVPIKGPIQSCPKCYRILDKAWSLCPNCGESIYYSPKPAIAIPGAVSPIARGEMNEPVGPLKQKVGIMVLLWLR